ncbi:MAG: T9SS type A sorting domain-containing protein [Candidatus Aegiribacteria sp.]|nr:T9SS type A sorting domain-containing protein [Candidatus Aegiribacteria sp.]
MKNVALNTSRWSRCTSSGVLLQMFVLLAVTSIAAAYSGSLVVSLHSGEYEIVQNLDGHRIEMEGFSQLMTPGKPMLPMKRFQILLPPGARAVSVDVIGSGADELPSYYDIQPFEGVLPLLNTPYLEEELVRLDEEWHANHEIVYLSDQPYPDRIAWLSGAGTLRKYSYASIAFCPITYHPISRRLIYHDRVDVAINYTLPDEGDAEAEHIERLLADCVADERAERLFINYRTFAGQYTSSRIEAQFDDLYDYVIVTTSDLIGSVTSSAFPAWKAELGYSLKTVLTTDPLIADQPGVDLEEQIRNFLREYYGLWGIEYVLFVGDYATVPMRICYPDSSFHVYDPSNPNLFAPGTPTDQYYTDLSYPDSLSWDLDGDGFVGEYNQDLPDFLPEIYVGRIPVNDTGRITYTLNKTVTFEQDAGSWKKNVLHPTTILFFENQNFSGYPFIDGASVIDSIETGLMDGWNITHMSEQFGIVTSLFDWPAVSEGVFINHWRNGQFAVVNWSGHGWSNSVSRSVWEWDDGDGVPESSNGEFYNLSLLNTVTSTNLDDDYPSVVFAISCNVGYPEPNAWGNLGIDLATKPGSGSAVGMVSASRPSAISSDWKNNPGGAEQICFDFNRYLISEGEHVGVALYDGKYDATTVYGWSHIYEYGNLYNVNLFGDPSLEVAGYPTGIEGGETAPGMMPPSLFPAYPNPFTSSTALRLTLPTSSKVLAVVYDISGRQVASLMEEMRPAGELLLFWDGRDNSGESLGQGIYFAVITVGNHQAVRRMMLLR